MKHNAGFVYFFRQAEAGSVRIGKTIDPEHMLCSLQRGMVNPGKPNVWVIVRCSDMRQAAADIKEQLVARHGGGFLYNLTDSNLEWVRSLRSWPVEITPNAAGKGYSRTESALLVALALLFKNVVPRAVVLVIAEELGRTPGAIEMQFRQIAERRTIGPTPNKSYPQAERFLRLFESNLPKVRQSSLLG